MRKIIALATLLGLAACADQSPSAAPTLEAAHNHRNFSGPATGSILSGDDSETGSNVDHNGGGIAAMQGSHGGPGVLH